VLDENIVVQEVKAPWSAEAKYFSPACFGWALNTLKWVSSCVTSILLKIQNYFIDFFIYFGIGD